MCLTLLLPAPCPGAGAQAPTPLSVDGVQPASGSGAEIEARVQAGRAALARGAYAEAAAHLTPAAEAGHVGAQLELAGLYADGLGVMRSEAVAAAWYGRALLSAAAAGTATKTPGGEAGAIAAAAAAPVATGAESQKPAIVVATASSAEAARAAWEGLRQKHGTVLAAVIAARPGQPAPPVPLLQAVTSPSHGRLFRVVLSGFATSEAAIAACAALRRAGLACAPVVPR